MYPSIPEAILLCAAAFAIIIVSTAFAVRLFRGDRW